MGRWAQAVLNLFLQQVEALRHLVSHFRIAGAWRRNRSLAASRLGEENAPQGRQTAEEHFTELHAVVGLETAFKAFSQACQRLAIVLTQWVTLWKLSKNWLR